MKTYLLAMLMMVTGGCNLIAPDYGTTRPEGSKEHVFPAKPMESAMRSESNELRAEIDGIDALWAASEELDAVDHAERNAMLGSWKDDAATYRKMADAYLEDTHASDSLQKLRIARIDSVTNVVSSMRTLLAEVLRLEEIKNIEAKLVPAGSFRFQGTQYSAILVNPKDLDIHLHWKNKAGEKFTSIQNLKNDLEKDGEKVVMITNAGMYNPDNSPQGLFIEKGKQLVPLDTTNGPSGQLLNFYMMPNGVFYIGNDGPKVVTTENFPQSQKGIQFATQSGPMLVINGSLHPKFNKGSSNTNIRSGVGITPTGQVIFAISDKPVNFYDFATLFRDGLHCTNALYLDGAISQMYLPNSKRMDLGGDFGPIVSVTAKN